MQLNEKHINISFNWGGLGDQIARAPALQALLDRHPEVTVTLFVFPSTLPLYTKWFLGHPRVVDIRPVHEFKDLPEGSYFIDFSETFQYQLGMHLTDHAHLTFMQSLPLMPLNYLPLGTGETNSAATTKLVALTPNFTSGTRSLAPEVWKGIIEGVKDLGLTPLLLGSVGTEFAGKATHVEPGSGCMDLRNNTTLLEAVGLMEKSVAVIGIDNGLIHLAGCTKTPIIVAYSTQIPENRMPRRAEGIIKTIMPKSACQGCETWLRFEPKHDFKWCYTKTYECVRGFAPEDFLKPLREIIGV